MISRVKVGFLLCFAVAIFFPLQAAELSRTQLKQTEQGVASAVSSILSASELVRARSWGLSVAEWQRYKELMQGLRGSISPSTISPIEVLGIHARDQAERERYAEVWAQSMHEDVTRILAFQQAYDAAGKKLYPNEPLIDVSRLPSKAEKPSAFDAGDRLLFFARHECPACDLLLGKLLKKVDEVSGIDIYLIGFDSLDDAAVRDWASSHNIKPEWVRARQITLNHDGGALDKLTQGRGKTPYVLRRRSGELAPLQASEL